MDIFPEFKKKVMVELMLNPKKRLQKDIEFEKRACSPRPSVPSILERKMDEINVMAIVRT